MLFAVAYMSFMDNEFVIEVIEAESFREAILKHSKLNENPGTAAWASCMPFELEQIKEAFFDYDLVIDAIEIPVSKN